MTGLVGWWPLNEDSGSTAHDLSGNGNHGSLSGGITQGVAGKGGLTAYSFDGSDDYFQVSQNFGGKGITISIWVRPETVPQSSEDTFLWDRGGGSLDAYGLTINNGDWRATLKDESGNGAQIYAGSPSAGNWHHLVLTYDGEGGLVKFFVNGEPVSSDSSLSNSVKSSSNTLFVGSYNGADEFFEGQIQNLMFHDRALSHEEIQTLYKWGNGDFVTPLNDENSSSAVARWPLDGDATDFWNSNNGTVNGASVVDGVRGEAYDFNNSGDEIVVENNSAFHGNGTGDFSVSAWVKPHSISNDPSNDRNTFLILRRSGVDPRVGWNLSFNSRSELGFLMEDSNNNQIRPTYSRGSNFELSSWYHVVATRNGDASKLFVNGVEKASATTSGFGDISTSEDLYIGQTNDTDSNYPDAFNGSVDEVRIYSRALSPAEVFELYQWGTRGRDMRKLTVNSRGL